MIAQKSPFYKNFVSVLVQTLLGTQRDDSLEDNLRKSWRRRIGGSLLFIMYTIVFFIVIMCLTAYQIQNRVHALNEQGGSVNIWNITRIADVILTRDKLISDRELSLSLQEADIFEIEKSIVEIDQSVSDADTKLVAALARLKPPVLVPANSNTNILVQMAAEAEGVAAAGNEIRSLTNDYLEKLAKQSRVKSAKNLIVVENQNLRMQIANLKNENNKIKEKEKNFEKIHDIIDELRFFHRSDSSNRSGFLSYLMDMIFGNVDSYEKNKSSYLFVTLPSEVLIMLIVVTMGIMGSMISITQVFFAGEDRPITFYLFRPLLGAVVAIGVYVITKAGVIVASNTPLQADGSAKLNSFFVSFISLIAGLMSEAAINTIKRAGTSFLRGDPVTEVMRYANGVQAAMAAENKTSKHLYPFFDADSDVVDKWLEEVEKVPGDAQRVIAAWLELPVRNLFSDLPPSQRSGHSSRTIEGDTKKAVKRVPKRPQRST